jgi:hypothetical protein
MPIPPSLPIGRACSSSDQGSTWPCGCHDRPAQCGSDAQTSLSSARLP